MDKIKAFLKEYWVGILIVLLVGDHFYGKYADKVSPPGVTRDATAVALGKAYANTISKSITKPLGVVASGSFTTLSDLTQAQRNSLDATLTEAWTPVAQELERRFGKSEDSGNAASLLSVKQFYTDLSYGAGN